MYTVYVTPNCPRCKTLDTVCSAYNIETQKKEVGVDITEEEFKQLMPDVREVPQVWQGDKRIGGLDEFKRHLIAGY